MVRRFLCVCCAVVVLASVSAGQVTRKIDVRKLSEQELRTIERQAKHGSSRAMTILGMAYVEGAVHRNVVEAVKWLKRASRTDDVAQEYLGSMYRNGVGVPKDPVRAREMYAKSAQQGDIAAQFDYASMCFNGEGGAQDIDTAAKYFEVAARQGDASSQHMIARMYEYGRGVVKDPEQAAKWYAAAAAQGYEPAVFALGIGYVEGSFVDRDFEHGRQLLEKATALGDWSAAVRLGELYLNGSVVKRDEATAYKWFAIARDLGGPDVASSDAMLAQRLSAEVVASERAQAREWKASHLMASAK